MNTGGYAKKSKLRCNWIFRATWPPYSGANWPPEVTLVFASKKLLCFRL